MYNIKTSTETGGKGREREGGRAKERERERALARSLTASRLLFVFSLFVLCVFRLSWIIALSIRCVFRLFFSLRFAATRVFRVLGAILAGAFIPRSVRARARVLRDTPGKRKDDIGNGAVMATTTAGTSAAGAQGDMSMLEMFTQCTSCACSGNESVHMSRCIQAQSGSEVD